MRKRPPDWNPAALRVASHAVAMVEPFALWNVEDLAEVGERSRRVLQGLG